MPAHSSYCFFLFLFSFLFFVHICVELALTIGSSDTCEEQKRKGQAERPKEEGQELGVSEFPVLLNMKHMNAKLIELIHIFHALWMLEVTFDCH